MVRFNKKGELHPVHGEVHYSKWTKDPELKKKEQPKKWNQLMRGGGDWKQVMQKQVMRKQLITIPTGHRRYETGDMRQGKIYRF